MPGNCPTGATFPQPCLGKSVDLRSRFGLTAQAAVRSIGKVADAFKVSREIAPVFRADAALSAVEPRSGRKNGFAEVKQKNSFVGKSHANQATYSCVGCGHTAGADFKATINIRSRALMAQENVTDVYDGLHSVIGRRRISRTQRPRPPSRRWPRPLRRLRRHGHGVRRGVRDDGGPNHPRQVPQRIANRAFGAVAWQRRCRQRQSRLGACSCSMREKCCISGRSLPSGIMGIRS
jgi:hypothetical protein